MSQVDNVSLADLADLVNEVKEVKDLLVKSRVNENSKELWGIDDIAQYFGFSKRHIEIAVISDPYFPKPVRLPSQRNRKVATSKVRYFIGDVVRYAQRQQR